METVVGFLYVPDPLTSKSGNIVQMVHDAFFDPHQSLSGSLFPVEDEDGFLSDAVLALWKYLATLLPCHAAMKTYDETLSS